MRHTLKNAFAEAAMLSSRVGFQPIFRRVRLMDRLAVRRRVRIVAKQLVRLIFCCDGYFATWL